MLRERRRENKGEVKITREKKENGGRVGGEREREKARRRLALEFAWKISIWVYSDNLAESLTRVTGLCETPTESRP